MLFINIDTPAVVWDVTKEERTFVGSFTSGASALLGRTYGGIRFHSSMVAFAYLRVDRASVSSIGMSLVSLHFFVNFGTLTQGTNVPVMSLSDTNSRGPATGGLTGVF